jgi:hypothetical protein
VLSDWRAECAEHTCTEYTSMGALSMLVYSVSVVSMLVYSVSVVSMLVYERACMHVCMARMAQI